MASPPERIVCLTEEPTEILYRLGEQDRVVGISAYTVRPPEAPRDKPVVSAFLHGSVEKIVALKPDLVVGFSDIQADLARDLIRAGLCVTIFNQRTLEEILDMTLMLGRIVGAEARARELVEELRGRLEAARSTTGTGPRPRVYFEEWDDPMITAIRWVSELIEVAGGVDVFAGKGREKMAQDRKVSPEEVLAARPEVYIGCWCGKPLDREAVLARPGWESLPAIRDGRVHEIDPSVILQPGPACFTDGLDALLDILSGGD